MFICTVLLHHVTWPDDYLTYDVVTLTDILITWPWYVYTWYLISDSGTWHVITRHLIPDTWYLTPVLDTWYLTPDTWHLISDTGTWHVITWHLIPDTWYMTFDMLSLFYMILVHLTWCCDTWLDTIIPNTCITLHIHDYHFYGDLTWLLYYYQTSGTPELICSWTLCSWTPVFLNPYNRETPDIILLMPCSCWSP